MSRVLRICPPWNPRWFLHTTELGSTNLGEQRIRRNWPSPLGFWQEVGVKISRLWGLVMSQLCPFHNKCYGLAWCLDLKNSPYRYSQAPFCCQLSCSLSLSWPQHPKLEREGWRNRGGKTDMLRTGPWNSWVLIIFTFLSKNVNFALSQYKENPFQNLHSWSQILSYFKLHHIFLRYWNDILAETLACACQALLGTKLNNISQPLAVKRGQGIESACGK